jgi:hypothetical protein
MNISGEIVNQKLRKKKITKWWWGKKTVAGVEIRNINQKV